MPQEKQRFSIQLYRTDFRDFGFYTNLLFGKPFAIRKCLTNAEYSLSGAHSFTSSFAKVFLIVGF